MRDKDLPLDDLGQLAHEEMHDKASELGNEDQAAELYDIPTRSDGELAAEQEAESHTGQ